MGWVRKTDPPPAHECRPPAKESARRNHDDRMVDYWAPLGNKDDLWRCDDCQKLWQIVRWINDGDDYLGWQSASFWNRWKYPAPKHPWPEPAKPTAVRQDQELPPRPGQSEAERWGDFDH